jgi:hypothetical protein
VLGVAVFAAGVVAVFTTDNGTGAAAVLAIGAAFAVVAVLGDRVQSVELGGVNLTIRDIARETFALARRPNSGETMPPPSGYERSRRTSRSWRASTAACAARCEADPNGRGRSST